MTEGAREADGRAGEWRTRALSGLGTYDCGSSLGKRLEVVREGSIRLMDASPLRMIGGVMAPLDRQPGRGAHARASAPLQIPSRPSTRAVARLRVSGTFVRKEVIAAQDDGGGSVVAPFDPSRRRRPASRPPPAPQDEWKDGFGLVGPSAGKGEDAAAVDVAVQGEGYFAEDGGGGGVAHFVADRVLGVDDGAVGGEEAVVPVGGLIVLEDVEAGVVEERAV